MKNAGPLAVVVAGALIGLGLFLGLRQRPAGGLPPASPPPFAAEDRAAPVTPSVAPRAEATPDAMRRDALGALDEFRRRMLDVCWRPALARAPEPSRSVYTVVSTFSADGTEIARGISEVRDEPSRADVAACLRSQPVVLRIPAPGAPFRIEIPLALP